MSNFPISHLPLSLTNFLRSSGLNIYMFPRFSQHLLACIFEIAPPCASQQLPAFTFWSQNFPCLSRIFFPTCQVRVVRFYQRACPPPPPPSSSSSTSCSPRPSPRLRLFHLHFRLANLANSSPSSSPTSQLSVHRWTSTGTCPAQCAPLDLNLGPAQLSVHRWTSTWDLPTSVCTAGPQPGTCPAQCAPLDLNGQIECQKRCQIECQIECQIKCHEICQIKCQKICQIICQKICQIECQKICQIECQKICQKTCQKI